MEGQRLKESNQQSKTGKEDPVIKGMNASDKATLGKFNRKIYPVFDLLETYLTGGAYIAHQDGEWLLCNPDGSGIASGKSIREMLVNFIMAEC